MGAYICSLTCSLFIILYTYSNVEQSCAHVQLLNEQACPMSVSQRQLISRDGIFGMHFMQAALSDLIIISGQLPAAMLSNRSLL